MQRTPLTESHVEALRGVGEERVLPAGHVITTPGQRLTEFIYILSGTAEIFNSATGEAYLNFFLGPTQFTGDIAFLSGSAASLAIRTREETRVIAAPRKEVLRLMSKIPEMSDIILSVFAARRRRQIEEQDSTLIVVAPDRDKECLRIESFLSRNKVPFKRYELDDPNAAGVCGGDARPGVAFGDKGLLDRPTVESVACLLGLDQPPTDHCSFDVLIVGGGPAGVAAAVYAGAEGLTSVLVEEIAVGGQAGTSSRIENYLGFPTGISGGDLVWRGEIQAMKFGTAFVRPRRVERLTQRAGGRFLATLDDGTEIDTGAVVVATGVQYRRLPWDGLEKFEGSGVYYAATQTEANYCTREPVIVVGGGNSAGQAAMYLSRSAAHVHVLVRSGSLAASMSDYLSSRLEADPNITLHFNTQIEALLGDDHLEAARIVTPDGNADLPARGVFVMVGAAPNTDWLKGVIALNDRGFIPTGEEAGGRSTYETSKHGIFAVGDVRAGSVKRVASSVGEGSVVISSVWNHVKA
ncbi:MAG: FAD-dependent oxidoreductase [Pseudomonadota bacterium]